MNSTESKTYEIRITASGKPFQAALAKIKKLAGAQYDATRRVWVVTLDPADSYRFESLSEGGYAHLVSVKEVTHA